MKFAGDTGVLPADSPEAQSYNRTKRWLGVADFAIGFAFLVALLATGWSGALRDFALRLGFENYSLAVFLYVLMLLLLSKALSIGLEYYGFRLEHRYHLSNQRRRSWLWDEVKGWLVGIGA